MKTVVICGSSPNVLNELATVQDRILAADVLALNGAIALIEAPRMFILDYNFSEQLKAMAGHPVELHSRVPGERSQRTKGKMEDFPNVDFWHDLPVTQGGTAVAAAAWLNREGYDQIILAGCPFDWALGYADGARVVKTTKTQDDYVTKFHRDGLRQTFLSGALGNTVSMSGYSRDLLGAPRWQQT